MRKLKKSIKGAENGTKHGSAMSEKQFVPIRVSTLRGDQKIDFDSYVKINDKHLLYLKKGDSFEGERLTRLKAKNLKKLFISIDEETLYRTYLSRNIELAYDSKSGKDLQTRSDIAQGAQQSNSEAIMEDPTNESLYKQAKEDVGRFAEFLQNEGGAFAHIMAMENNDKNIPHHCAAVSTLAIALSKKLGNADASHVQLLALGCLLHDIEHLYSGINIARPIKLFTEVELKAYRKHPIDSVTRVKDKKHFDPIVLNIIAQHEEFVDGQGFPQKLPESKLDPMSVIASSCNALDRLISFEGVPKKSAPRQLIISAVGRFPLQHLQHLSDLMNSLKT